ncbi:endonuclease III domain-containing protein [Desulfurella sp.]|uniref:endonuclease III domain-containing protein n=1 Tax=Desulfurella sp. TaxID=1962857 RepID=UPI0025C045D2|nr:endonuclease III domain-containing protein [Desulfurella sp.]
MLIEIYKSLLQFFGKQYWWPAETKDEIIIGAILTQNTSWQNVEKAIFNLKKEGFCNLCKIRDVPLEYIQQLIKPAGFYKQKSVYLKEIAKFFANFDENTTDTLQFRKMLLNVKGIGLETADSILLYAFSRPVFVIDAYTIRFLKRKKLFDSSKYEEVQSFFMQNLPKDVELFKEYHALIVKLAKTYCRKNPNCTECPIKCA